MQVKGSQPERARGMPMDLDDRELLNEICDAMHNCQTAMMNMLKILEDLQRGQMMLMAMAQEHRPADIKPLPRG